jgi:hypothetical protein
MFVARVVATDVGVNVWIPLDLTKQEPSPDKKPGQAKLGTLVRCSAAVWCTPTPGDAAVAMMTNTHVLARWYHKHGLKAFFVDCLGVLEEPKVDAHHAAVSETNLLPTNR